MNHRSLFKSFLALILMLSLFVNIVPFSAFAEEEETTPNLEDLIAGVVSVEDVYGKLDSETVPEIIGYENAVSKTHVKRLYEEENDDLNRIVFLNADGTKTVYLFDYPVKYFDKAGNIKDITLDIADSDIPGQFETESGSSVTTFSKNISNGIKLSGNDTSVSLVPHIPKTKSSSASALSKVSADSVAKRLDDKTICYDYDEKTTIEYSLTYTGFKEDIVVNEYTGQTEYDFTLYTNGLELREIDGSFYLVDDTGTIKATLGEIIIFTADEKNNTIGELRAQTVTAKQEYLLTISVDPDFLASEKTLYPIRIDPTVEICYDNNGTGAISDVTLNSLDSSSPASGALYVGLRQTYGISRILMKFPGLNLNSLGNNIRITNATVEMRDLLCESTNLQVNCYVFSGNEWNESTVQWSNVDAGNISTFLSSNIITYANGIENPVAHRYSFDITDAVEGWRVGNYNPNKGIIFTIPTSQESGTVYDHRTFASYNRASNKPSLMVTYESVSNFLADDTYYLNNQYCGDYLRYASSSATATSGLISSLGNSIRWEVREVDGGYVLRSKSDTTKYLGVPSDTSSDTVSIVTVNNSAIPSRCIWSISISEIGGCIVKSAYNSRYLFSHGNSVYTSPRTGTVGTTTYESRLWRIASTSYYGNSSLYERIELPSGYKFKTLYLFASDIKQPSLCDEYDNVLWRTSDNFSFTGYDASRITVDSRTGNFTATSSTSFYSTTIVATHKVTGRTATFTLVINPKAALVGVSNFGHDHSSALNNIVSNISACGYSDSTIYTGAFSISNIDSYLDTDTNNIFVIRSHAGILKSGDTQTGICLLLNDDEASPVLYRSYGSISTLDLTNMKLIMFIACCTAAGDEGGLNFPSVAVSQGATTSVGFEEEIGCSTANNWTQDFFDLIESGLSVQTACVQLAGNSKYSSTTMTSFVVCGYDYARLT